MINYEELDRIVEPKNKVQIRIVLSDVKKYKKFVGEFKTITKKAEGTMSVKMI